MLAQKRAFMPLYIAQSGDLDSCYLPDRLTTLKDRATQLLIKYKSGALVTQYSPKHSDIVRVYLETLHREDEKTKE